MDPWNTLLQFLLLNLNSKQRPKRFQMLLKQIGIVTEKHPKKMGEKKKNHQSKLDLLPPCLSTDLPRSLAPS